VLATNSVPPHDLARRRRGARPPLFYSNTHVLSIGGALPAAVTAALRYHTATQGSSRPSARLLPRLSWAVLVCDGVLYAWEQLASPPGSLQDDDLDAAQRRSPLALKLDLPNEAQFDSAGNSQNDSCRYISSGNL
jgi:hypothetical protein